MRTCEQLMAQHRFAELEQLLDRLAPTHAHDPLFHVTSAWHLRATQQPREAEEAARRAVALDPQGVNPLRCLAETLLQNRQWSAARVALDDLHRVRPDWSPVHQMYAYALRGLGDLGNARRAGIEAVRLDGADPAAHLALGRAVSVVDPALAERAYREVLARDPEHAQARQGLEREQEYLRPTGPGVDGDPRRRQVRAFMEEGLLDEAARVLQSLTDAYPDAVSLQTAWTALHSRRGDLGAAEHAAREVVRREPGWVVGRVNLANLLLDQQRPQEAQQVAREGLDIDPRSALAHDVTAVALERSGDVPGALHHAREALRCAADDPQVLQGVPRSARLVEHLADAGLAKDDPRVVELFHLATRGEHTALDEAVARLLADHADTASAHHVWAQSLAQRGRFQDAAAEAERAAELEPGARGIRATAARCCLAAGHLLEGAHHARATVELAPDDVAAQLLLSEVLDLLGDHEGSVRAAEQAVELAPDDLRAREAAGFAARVTDRERCLAHLRAVVEADPGNEHARGALAAFEQGEGIGPSRRTIDYLLRLSEARRHDDVAAIAARLVEAFPDDARGLIHLAIARLNQGRPEEAEAAQRRVLELEPGLPTHHLYLAIILRRQGRHEDALEPLTRAAALDPTDVIAHRELAEVHGLLGDTEQAEFHAEQARALEPGGPARNAG